MKTKCINFKGYKDRDGYGRICINGKAIGAHVLALRLSLGRKLKSGMIALHRCHNPSCINPLHLKEGTPKQNMADAWKRGSLTGEKLCHKNSKTRKYSEMQVNLVRHYLTLGFPIKVISERTNVSKATVYHIKYGTSHKMVK